MKKWGYIMAAGVGLMLFGCLPLDRADYVLVGGLLISIGFAGAVIIGDWK